jgi:hypothetical protein
VYSTCLFCHADLGANEVVEHFPVGRRLAFDGEKGRLWVICRSCERWNLTPLEERWEAIEECEKLFRDTKLRMSTEHIGLARVREGLELVRVGDPLRPEMAAWRYGDQFGRRRRKYFAYAAGAAVVGGALIAGGIEFGLFAGAGVNFINVLHLGRNALWTRRTVAHVSTPEGVARVARGQLRTVRITTAASGEPVLAFSRRLRPGERASMSARWTSGALSDRRQAEPALAVLEWAKVNLSADDQAAYGDAVKTGNKSLVKMALAGVVAQHKAANSAPPAGRRFRTNIRGKRVEIPLAEAAPALSSLLPVINARGGTERVVSRAVMLLDAKNTHRLLRMATDITTAGASPASTNACRLSSLPAELRLALEMATHEDDERRALEGELAALEERWKEAEEIAGISDNMFLPASVTEWMQKIRS